MKFPSVLKKEKITHLKKQFEENVKLEGEEKISPGVKESNVVSLD